MTDRIPPNQSCENCRYWTPNDGGICRRSPPSVNVTGTYDGVHERGIYWFTKTLRNDWCGEWRETWAAEQAEIWRQRYRSFKVLGLDDPEGEAACLKWYERYGGDPEMTYTPVKYQR